MTKHDAKRKSGAHDVGEALRGLRGGPGRVVLIIDPSPDQQSRLARLVTIHGHRVIGTSSMDGANALLDAFPVDLVLLCEAVLGAEPLRVVGEIVGRQPGARVVIMTAPQAPESGVRPARPRALEYISRPFTGEVLTTLLAG